MRKVWLIVLTWFLLLMIASKNVSANNGKIFVQYHLWYGEDESLPGWDKPWYSWHQCHWGVEGSCPVSEKFVTPWKRQTYSRLGLPLVGFYSSGTDLEVVRYHFEQAKKAGIDGMFASVYGGGWWPRFDAHKQIAEEVGIKIGVELYGGVTWDTWKDRLGWEYPMKSNGCKTSRNYQANEMVHALRHYMDSSSGVKVDNKPVIWIANWAETGEAAEDLWRSWFPDTDCEAPEVIYRWGNVDQIKEVLSKVENDLGRQIFVMMTGNPIDNVGKNFANIPQIGRINGGSNIGHFWGTFGYNNQRSTILNSSNRQSFESSYKNLVASLKMQTGGKLNLHLYPGFDERGIFPSTRNALSGINKPRAVISRSGNGMYEENDGFLKFGLGVASEYNLWVALESWNDWGEQHQIEPGFSFSGYGKHGDYFSPLRRVAEYKGISNPNFTFPVKEIMEEELVKYGRQKQFEGKRVKIRGKLGFVDGASCGDGVLLKFDYIDDDLSYTVPSYLPSTNWVNGGNKDISYSNLLTNFEFDITKYLDKPGLRLGIESKSNPNCDNVSLSELWLDWYGKKIDLIKPDILSGFGWASAKGDLSWGMSNRSGTNRIERVKLADGNEYNCLHLHPNWDVGGYIYGQINWFGVESQLVDSQCVAISGATINNLIDWYGGYKGLGRDEADLNCDGRINIDDLLFWYGKYRK